MKRMHDQKERIGCMIRKTAELFENSTGKTWHHILSVESWVEESTVLFQFIFAIGDLLSVTYHVIRAHRDICKKNA